MTGVLTPLQYARIVSKGRYQMPRHVLLMQRFVMGILARPGRATGIIQVPVRHGKSELLSKILPAWYLTSFPDHKVILTGYGNDFASQFGEAVRNLFRQWAYPIAGLGIENDHTRRQDWAISGHAGGMRSVGTGGPISGHGAHLLISDDQVKDQKHADSPVERDALWRWWCADAYSRLEPGGKTIVILSRRNQDDLVGRLLKVAADGGDRCDVLRLSALCDDLDDPLGRRIGEPLWPERYGAAELEAIRTQFELAGQAHQWECLYQQNPVGDPASAEWPREYFDGIMVDDVPLRPDQVRYRVLALDPSKNRHGKSGDYASFSDVTVDTAGLVWVRCHAAVMPVTQIEERAVQLVAAAGPVPFQALGIETNDLQYLIAQNVMKGLKREGLSPAVLGIESKDAKEVRIRADLSPLLAQRRLRIVRGTSGARHLLNQMQAFPNGSHDDCPDSLSMATRVVNWVIQGRQAGGGVSLLAAA